MRLDVNKAKQLRREGKTYREIAQEMGVSKSTVANKLQPKKFNFTESSTHDPRSLETMHFLPPGGGHDIVPSFQQYSGIFRAGKDFYLPPDLAIRDSRPNARNMYQSLFVREPLQARIWASAEQDWHIEPENKKDANQVEVARKIQRTIESIPDFLKLRYSLLKSVWFGVYGVQLNYQFNNLRQIEVKRWSELHGDSLVFKMPNQDVGVYVSATGGPDTKNITSEAGYIGRAHVFEDDRDLHWKDGKPVDARGNPFPTDAQGNPYRSLGASEREAVIIMSYDNQAADFLDPRSAGGVKGLGIRSTIYPTWYQMTEMIGWMADWMERTGTGYTIYKFIRGNVESYNAAVKLSKSQSNQSCVMVPVDLDRTTNEPIEGVQRIEVPSTGLDNLLKVIDGFFGAQIRRFIIGQDSTSQPVNTGMGSKIAEVHENTFERIIKFDCVNLQETLTRELVWVVQKYNHPESMEAPCKFVIDFAQSNVQEKITSAKTLYEMGVEFDADELRNICGFGKPNADSEIIKKSEPAPMIPGLHPGLTNPLEGANKELQQEE